MKFKDMFLRKSPFKAFSSPIKPMDNTIGDEELVDEEALASQEQSQESSSEEEDPSAFTQTRRLEKNK